MKKILIATLAITTLAMGAYASSLGGSKADPVLTETKLNAVISNNLILNVVDSYKYYTESLIVSELVENELNIINCVENDMITVEEGAKVILITGSVIVEGTGKLIDSSDGREITNPYSLLANRPYIVTENTTFDITVTSTSGKILIIGEYEITNPYEILYDNYAQALHSLSLFKGTGTGYRLDRESTRMEAVIMLVRLMGQASQASSYTGTATFLDIPEWATNYAAFAQDSKYISGYSSTRFGAEEIVTSYEYFSFLLRALGYKDNVDFVWTEADQFALNIGIVPYLPDTFNRDFIAYASFNALTQVLNGGEMTLAQKLIYEGVITEAEYEYAKEIVNRNN